MNIWEIIIAPGNAFFTICLLVCLAITLLEILSFCIGFSNQWVDGLLPDSLKADVSIGSPSELGALVAISNWVYFGRCNLFVWLMLFWGGWGVLGILSQAILFVVFSAMGSIYIVAPISLLINLVLVRYLCKLIALLTPNNISTAIELHQLEGFKAEIIVGVSKINFPAQAKVQDQFNNWHYVMVEPMGDEEIHAGESVILYEFVGGESFKVVSYEKFNLDFQEKYLTHHKDS